MIFYNDITSFNYQFIIWFTSLVLVQSCCSHRTHPTRCPGEARCWAAAVASAAWTMALCLGDQRSAPRSPGRGSPEIHRWHGDLPFGYMENHRKTIGKWSFNGILMGFNGVYQDIWWYTLWWTNIAMENGHGNSGISHEKCWFSIAMWLFTRGYIKIAIEHSPFSSLIFPWNMVEFSIAKC